MLTEKVNDFSLKCHFGNKEVCLRGRSVSWDISSLSYYSQVNAKTSKMFTPEIRQH